MRKPIRGRLVKSTLAVALIAFSQTTYANFACAGKMLRVALSPSGTVQVHNGYGTHYLCEIDGNSVGFTPESCKAVFSMLLAAKLSGEVVTFYYRTGNYTSCADLPNWAAPDPKPYHILES